MASNLELINFSQAETLSDLAVMIGVKVDVLETLATGEHQSSLYKKHKIPKRRSINGAEAYRVVWEAERPEILVAHRSFSRKFEAYVSAKYGYPDKHVHGYVRGRSTLTNASKHAGAKVLLCADIIDFFSTVTDARVQGVLESLGINLSLSPLLAKFLTIDGSLPLGLHASPLIANLVCKSLDVKLSELASTKDATYTRYSDDLTFSSSKDVPSQIDVSGVLESEGFALSPGKYRISKLGQSHYVTGLSVSDTVPHLPRKLKRRMRQELYFADKYGVKDHLGRIKATTHQSGVNRIDGMLRYFHAIEPTLALKLRRTWGEILVRDEMEPIYGPRYEKQPYALALFIDEAEIDTPEGKLLVLGCAAIEDLETVSKATLDLARERLIDPFTAGSKEALKKKGLHFADLSEEIRTDYIRELGFLPFRGYIAYDFLLDSDSYEDKYLELLKPMIIHRLLAADRANLTIVIEQNSKISFAKIRKLIDDAYAELCAKSMRSPLTAPEVMEGKKAVDPCLSVVDFILGVFGHFAMMSYVDPASALLPPKPKQRGETARKRFERLRDKIRVIISKPTGEVFSRRRPFLPWPEGKPTETIPAA